MTIKDKHVCTVKNQCMEKFNPFQTGHGVHKSAKYPDRRARKAEARREIQRAGF